MTRACGADDIKNILHPALFRKLRFQMIDDKRKLYGEFGLVNLIRLIPSIASQKSESS
jgi:hypothetical protein